jgi:glycine/D-amino acid oxidase-like deaminating enzyme
MTNYICKSAGIVGAGIQGICTGLQLLKKNIPVTIFDKNDPAKMASYGNAGHFSPYAVLQFNRPDILVNIPQMLFSSYGPLALKWNYVPKMIPWMWKFVKNCNTKSMLHTAKYMHQILDLSLDAYDDAFKEIDTTGLIERKGIIYAWTNENLKSRNLEIKVREDLGVKQTLITKKEISDLEPNLKPIFDAGVLFDYAWHARDPYAIAKKLFDLYIKKGGKFIKENVTYINQTNSNETLIKTEHSFNQSFIGIC